MLGVVPKDIQRHMLLSGSFGAICRFRKYVGPRAKAGMDFPSEAGQALPGLQPEPHTLV